MEKRRLILYAVLVCIIGIFGYALLRADDGGIAWLSDYKEALRVARQTHKPLLVEFRCEA